MHKFTCQFVSFDINLFLNHSQLMNPSVPQSSSLLFVVSFFHPKPHLPFQNHFCALHHHRYISSSKFYKSGTKQYVFFFGLLVFSYQNYFEIHPYYSVYQGSSPLNDNLNEQRSEKPSSQKAGHKTQRRLEWRPASGYCKGAIYLSGRRES